MPAAVFTPAEGAIAELAFVFLFWRGAGFARRGGRRGGGGERHVGGGHEDDDDDDVYLGQLEP